MTHHLAASRFTSILILSTKPQRTTLQLVGCYAKVTQSSRQEEKTRRLLPPSKELTTVILTEVHQLRRSIKKRCLHTCFRWRTIPEVVLVDGTSWKPDR